MTLTIAIEGKGVIANSEYERFIIHREYTDGLFIKFTGDPVADEHVNQLFKLVIKQDFLRS